MSMAGHPIRPQDAPMLKTRIRLCLLAATLEPILNPLWVALWAHEPSDALFIV